MIEASLCARDPMHPRRHRRVTGPFLAGPLRPRPGLPVLCSRRWRRPGPPFRPTAGKGPAAGRDGRRRL